MACDGLLFLILGYFCPFILLPPPLTARKIKIQNSKKNKKQKRTPADIIILHKCTKIMIICRTVPEIWHVTDVRWMFV